MIDLPQVRAILTACLGLPALGRCGSPSPHHASAGAAVAPAIQASVGPFHSHMRTVSRSAKARRFNGSFVMRLTDGRVAGVRRVWPTA